MKLESQNRLEELEQARHQLRMGIRHLREVPSALEIEVGGERLQFPVAGETGKVASLPDKGAWGWAKNLRWADLQKFLEKKGYTVRLLRTSD